MEININNNNNINNLDLEERSEPWARRCLDGLCGHVGDVLCAKNIAVDGWHESVEQDRLITPEEYNELAPSIAEEFIKRWLAKMGDGICNRMVAEILRADAKHLEKAWEKWQERGANAGPVCDKCGEERNAIGGRVCWTCDLDMPEFEYKKVGHYHQLTNCYCKVGGHEEDDAMDEFEQLAQVSVNGRYLYEFYYNARLDEVMVEFDHFRENTPVYYYYPAKMTIPNTLADLMGREEFELTMTDININGKEPSDVEVNEMYEKSWNFHIGLERVMQFNIKTGPYKKDYDDGNQPPRHTHDDGFDEYDYDCEDEDRDWWETASQEEERRQEMAENMERQMEAYYEEDDEGREKEKFE